MKSTLFATASSLSLLIALPASADGNQAGLLQMGSANGALIQQDGGSDNEAALRQIGTGNSADVDQQGDEGVAGPTVGADLLDKAMRQEGDNNVLTTNQGGVGNRIGTLGSGLDQLGDRGDIGIVQSSDLNLVGQVLQQGVAGAPALQNRMRVDQSGGDGNFIRNTSQTNTRKNGPANTLSVTQDGNGNIFGEKLGGAGTGLLQDGTKNAMTLNQIGDNNGAADGVSSSTGAFGATAAQAGAERASAKQVGNRNQLRYDAMGDRNLFGSNQIGNANDAGIMQTGTGNEAASSQIGNRNMAKILQSPLFGFGGTGNTAASAIVGNSNLSLIGQFNSLNQAVDTVAGNNNALFTLQLGGSNISTNAVSGNGNTVWIDQASLFVGNSSQVDIDGTNSNGNGNDVTVKQGGTNTSEISIFGDRSTVDVHQLGNNNSTVGITGNPEGSNNDVFILQANLGLGTNNSDVSISGDRNDVTTDQVGSNTLSVSILGGADAGSPGEGVNNSVSAIQSGGNDGTLFVRGDRNTVNLDQSGFLSNNAATVTIDGTANEGDSNSVDVTQAGRNGLATISITGDRNRVMAGQSGRNTANLTIAGANGGEGDRNTFNLNQTFIGGGFFGTSGARNTITAVVYGKDNNTGLSFTGSDAIAVAGSLAPGDMFQTGRNNDIQLNVGDALSNSNGNAIAFSQTGRNNTIIGSILDGDDNQVAVVQAGTANLTNFSQIGSFNVLGVSQ